MAAPDEHTQIPLFDTPPAQRVAETFSGKKPIDKDQATFQRLVRQLEEQRALLARWQAYVVRYQQRLGAELRPLEENYRQCRRQMARQLDATADQPGLLRGKVQRKTLSRLIIDLTYGLLQEGPDAAMEAIHDKYSSMSFADNQADQLAVTQDLLESIFGVAPQDAEQARTDEDLYKIFGEHMARQESARVEKRKTARQEAAAAKKEEAAKAVSQTVRAVYRKLASSLHPDREADPEMRERKTALMQRVNQAYDAGDLLTLLNLQFEIEQIDAGHLEALSKERLQHYNQVLREQLAELKTEIEGVTRIFRPLLKGRHLPALTPETVDQALNAEIVMRQHDLDQLRADIEAVRDPTQLKAMLRDYRPEMPPMDLGDLDLIFGGFDEVFEEPRTKRRRKTR